MTILIVGCDKGSWQVRGKQLGTAMRARVTSTPSARDWAQADVIVLVKHAADRWRQQAAQARVPVVWDVLDYWTQPEANDWTPAQHVAAIRQVADAIRASLLISATEAMARDLGGVYLPHHSWPGLRPTPIRPQAQVVAYQGTPKYLGPWRLALDTACARLGLEFIVNPPDLRQADILVSFRAGRWDGWACRQWKSGVKFVNAIAAGRPVLAQPSAAFAEINPSGIGVDAPESLEGALKVLRDPALRQMTYEHGLTRAPEFAVERIAQRYLAMLQTVQRSAAA